MSGNTLQNFFAGQNYFEIFKTSFGLCLFIVLLVSLLVQLIINYAGGVSKLLSKAMDIENNAGEQILKTLQKLAINHIFDWFLDKLDAYHPVRQFKAIGYGEGISLFFSILLIIIYPKDLLTDEWIGISIFTLLVIEKLWIITYLKSIVFRANRLGVAGARCYQENQLDEALRYYRQALSFYYRPWVSANTFLDRERAELLEQIAVILDHQHRFEEALINYNRVLTLYNRPHLITDQTLNHTMVRLLRQTAILFYRLGDRKNAQKRYQLIYEQTGKRYVLPGGFMRRAP